MNRASHVAVGQSGASRSRGVGLGRVVFAIAMVTGGAANAAEACVDLPDLATAGPLTTAVVRQGVAKTHFYKGAPTDRASACPGFSDKCWEKAYVVAGDRLIVSGTVGDFVCAHFVAPRKRGKETFDEIVRAGWLTSADLAPEPAAKPPVWTGDWARVEAAIIIQAGRQPGMLAIKGDATFGSMDPDRVRRGAVNMGEIAADVRPVDGGLSFAMGDKGAIPVKKAAETDCKVWMRRVGPWLLVEDNRQCGGANVSFSGLYARKVK